MSVWLLKQRFKNVLTVLARLTNFSFETGTFPSLLKTAKVVPIYKKDDTNLTSNYCPISILPVSGKVFENIFYKSVEGFFKRLKILCLEQFGFRKIINDRRYQ